MSATKLPYTVAIVDDDLGILDAVKMVLEQKSWLVNTYASGEEFISALDYWVFDCMVLDTHLPGIDGVGVVEHLAGKSLALPVVVLTAQPYSPQTLSLKNTQVYDILTKPVSDLVLVSAIESAILAGCHLSKI